MWQSTLVVQCSKQQMYVLYQQMFSSGLCLETRNIQFILWYILQAVVGILPESCPESWYRIRSYIMWCIYALNILNYIMKIVSKINGGLISWYYLFVKCLWNYIYKLPRWQIKRSWEPYLTLELVVSHH